MQCKLCGKQVGTRTEPAYRIRQAYNERGRLAVKEILGHYCTACMTKGFKVEYKILGDQISGGGRTFYCIRCGRPVGTRAEPAYQIQKGILQDTDFVVTELVGLFCGPCIVRGDGQYYGAGL